MIGRIIYIINMLHILAVECDECYDDYHESVV